MDDYKQYSICFPQNYAKDIARDLGKAIRVYVDEDRITDAMKNNGVPSEKTVCLFCNPNDKLNFIIMDCCNDDWLYGVCARCSINNVNEVEKVFIDWVSKLRLEYGEAVPEEIIDSGDTNSLFKSMVSRYSLKI